MTKIGDIRAKSEDELSSMLLDLRKEQFNLRFQRATGQSEGIARVKVIRRDIARVKTIQHQNKPQTAANVPAASKPKSAQAGAKS